MTTDSAPSSLRIVLNVGGVRFETTRQTIEKSLMLIGLVDTVRAGFSASSPTSLAHHAVTETCARVPARRRGKTSLLLTFRSSSSTVTRHSLARCCG